MCGLVASQPQRRIAKPIPLGFNPKPFSPQFAAKSYNPQFVSPKPTVSSPSQYNAQEYDPSLNAVGFSTAAPSPSPLPFSATPRIAQYQEGRTSEYVTPIPIIRFDKEQSIDGSYKARYVIKSLANSKNSLALSNDKLKLKVMLKSEYLSSGSQKTLVLRMTA